MCTPPTSEPPNGRRPTLASALGSPSLDPRRRPPARRIFFRFLPNPVSPPRRRPLSSSQWWHAASPSNGAGRGWTRWQAGEGDVGGQRRAALRKSSTTPWLELSGQGGASLSPFAPHGCRARAPMMAAQRGRGVGFGGGASPSSPARVGQ
jgi:hypothetical protein